jgi:hypothetical protein
MKTSILLSLASLFVLSLTCITSTSAQILDNYWIYEDFSQFETDTLYVIEPTNYNTVPNGISIKTEYANFEESEGECHNESPAHLRVRGIMDGGYVEFTVPDAKKVVINVKGKSTVQDRTVNIYRNGSLVSSFSGLDRNNCAVFSEIINSTEPVTYKIEGGDIESTKPIVVASIIVSKYTPVVPTCDVALEANPNNMGYATGEGAFSTYSEVIIRATPYLGYIFENWTSKGQIISTDNPFFFTLVNDTTITANFKREENLESLYWIYEDFSQLESAPDYLIEEKNYKTSPNNINLKTEYANFEQTEGNCNNESKYHLRIRGAADNGWTEFTVPNAKSVKIKVKGKSTSQDRSILIYRNGSLIRSIMNLDRDNCGEFSEELNSDMPVTYKIMGGDAVSTKPVIVTSIIVTKNNPQINYYDINVTSSPVEAGTTTGSGTYYEGEKVQLKAIANFGYAFDSWQINNEIISKNNPYNFNASENMSITANFIEIDMRKYWIYEDFNLFEDEEAIDYLIEEKTYKTNPNDITIKTEYANFERTEGDCGNDSKMHLRIRGLLDNGYAEFTVPDASVVTINMKGKSTELDRVINISRNGQIVKSYANLDRNTCASFIDRVNSKTAVTYKITGGNSESSKPIVITSVSVEKDGEVGIPSVSNNDSFMLYPNPADDHLKINFSDTMENANISIYTTTGICVLEQGIENGENINLSNITSGIYIITITGTNYVGSQKFVKR